MVINRKSRLAIEYLHRLMDLEPRTAIYWIYAAGEVQFRNAFLSILEVIPREFRQQFEEIRKYTLAHGENVHTDALELVHSWLQSETSGPWFIILDNADDPDGFLQSGGSTKSLAKFLPQSANGYLLITSRRKDVAISLVSGEDCLIHLDVLAVEESIHLFRKLLPSDSASDGQVLNLAQALDRLPLAIKQAAAYISSLSISIEDYSVSFLRNEENQRELLQQDFGDLTRATDVSNAVFLTWQMSFDHVTRQSRSAGDVMALMATFNREGIQEFMLKHVWPNEMQCNRNIGLILGFSLISRNAERRNVFCMHRLVQITVRQWLLRKDEQALWEREALRILLELFQDATTRHKWVRCQALYPHAKSVIEYSFTGSCLALKMKLITLLSKYEHPPLSQLASRSNANKLESIYQSLNRKKMPLGLLKTENLVSWLGAERGLLMLTGAPGTGKSYQW